MARIAPFRVRLWDINPTTRGRDNLVAVIDDAKDIGVSAYANAPGEMFFTIPMRHPHINQIEPWLRHYEVSRFDIDTGTYSAIGVGLLDDIDASASEVVVYGRDYLSLFDLSISGSNTSYTSQTYNSIITTETTGAIVQPGISTPSVLEFLTAGTIQATAETTTVLTSYEPRLQFIRGLCEILSSDNSTRPIFKVSRTPPFTVTWETNAGSDIGLALRYGTNVNDFRFNPGMSTFGTRGYAIGQQREGAALLFGVFSNAQTATYGLIQRATVFLDVINQSALDRRTRRFSRDLGIGNRNISLRIRSGAVKPVSGWDIADSPRIYINHGLAQVDDRYTIWGWEWTGTKNGSEDLFLDILPKQT